MRTHVMLEYQTKPASRDDRPARHPRLALDGIVASAERQAVLK
jgi:hypothetical protein